MTRCCYCKQEFPRDDMRPYGPDGAFTCHPCATSTPEREATAHAAFDAILNAAAAMSPLNAVLLTDDGLHPLNLEAGAPDD